MNVGHSSSSSTLSTVKAIEAEAVCDLWGSVGKLSLRACTCDRGELLTPAMFFSLFDSRPAVVVLDRLYL
jgi:hypothetical protein